MSEDPDGIAARTDPLVDGVLAGSRRALAQAITLVETGGSAAQRLVAALYRHTGQAHVVGITGSPGTGKSTLVGGMAQRYRARDIKVGIVAVDPTSPFSGGAILGDRIRMRDLTGDSGVFIRSMATRGNLGGLAIATSDVVRVLDAAQYRVIIVETVGVGQAELDVATMAHTVVVVEAPGLGDDIQALKAGLMEVADIFVVNKNDLSGADALVSTLRSAIGLASGQVEYVGHHQFEPPIHSDAPGSGPPGGPWQIPVTDATALHNEGIDELVGLVDAHRDYLHASGLWRRRERERVEADLKTLIKQIVVQRLMEKLSACQWDAMVEDVLNRKLDPQIAADELWNSVS